MSSLQRASGFASGVSSTRSTPEIPEPAVLSAVEVDAAYARDRSPSSRSWAAAQLQQDLDSVREFYQNHGYIDVSIPEVRQERIKNGVRLVIHDQRGRTIPCRQARPSKDRRWRKRQVCAR